MSAEDGSGIAVVGMAGRFPGARDLDAFWRNLRDGRESIRRLSDEEAVERGLDPALLADPHQVRAVAEIEDVDSFDAPFFGFNHREAEIMDPQQRIFLEHAWQALESAGCDPEAFDGAIALFAGATTSTYLLFNLLGNPALSGRDPLHLLVANAADSLATRVSYKLNLKGPSFTVQCACSTSLVAVHLACESLLNEECDLALAGGVSVNVGLRAGYRYQEQSILSPDGHCRPFDAGARGTVFGAGVGVVALKRLEDALAGGDPIRAVIKGSAVNNDGSLKVGYTAPSVEGQARVISEALSVAGVEADSISYVEGHGTATDLGDPIEVQALTRAFGEHTERKGFCALGSVKANIGHLDIAAGVAGLIKTILALEHRRIPPSLNYETPNPKIDFAASPVYVNAELAEWRSAGPRRAGVSSFGFGGTNAHVVVEEAPARAAAGSSRPWQLLTLSAKTEGALDRASAELAEHLGERQPDLADVAYTLAAGRRAFNQRRIVVCRDVADAAACLAGGDERVLTRGDREPWDRPVAFLFPGQGAQYVDMGRELYEGEAAFRDVVDRCARTLEPPLGLDLRRVLYPSPDGRDEAARRLGSTEVTQPALFVVEYALASLWMEWGVEPAAMIGHSIGEYVAACLAGVFSLSDGLRLVAARGRLMAELPAGSMLAVPLAEDDVRPLLGDGVDLAAVNAPARCVVSGPTEEVEAFAGKLAERGTRGRPLATSHAFHSAMMEPILDRFAAEVARVELKPPEIPYLSNLTGTWVTAGEATDPACWTRHLRSVVRFADGVAELASDPERIQLEVGPGRTLSTLARASIPKIGDAQSPVVTSMRHPGDAAASDLAVLLTALGRLWLEGRRVEWPRLFAGEDRRRLPLPVYSFDRHRYWIEPGRPASASAPAEAPPAGTGELHERPDLATDYVAPRSDLERRIAEVWQDALGVEKIGVRDNFFDLGGDSFLAVEVIGRLRQTLEREVPAVSLYEGLTVESLAGLVTETVAGAGEQEARLEELEAARDRRRQFQRRRRSAKDRPTLEFDDD